jgi:hypothetical protein
MLIGNRSYSRRLLSRPQGPTDQPPEAPTTHIALGYRIDSELLFLFFEPMVFTAPMLIQIFRSESSA